MMLRNHGSLAVGQTAAQAWVGMFFLERACAQQVAALSGGREHVLMAPDAAQAETKEQGQGIGFISALAWPGALRMLDRKSPGYDT
jgi:ribulose-5-phosphate 4-epimerase/fuculose-1-phosphate aldolase